MENFQLQAAIVYERLPVEKIYHPFVCGPNNAIIKKLMEETGARINVPPPRIQKDEIVISGEKDDVIWCKAAIMRIYQEKKQKCQTISVEIKKSQHKYVIGLRGSNLQEILDITGVSVEVPFRDSPSERITLRGEQEKLGLGLKMVYSKAKIISERIPVEKIYHPFVCGPNNAIIRKLMEETGARIDLPPPGVLKDEIVVFGDKDGVYKCKATIIGIYQEKKLKCQTMSVQVKKFQHKYVVGPDGSYLQEILANTGVSVEVPLLESPSERITLRGEQEKLGLALKMVCSKVNVVICAVVNAPEWLHKFIIGEKRENIRRVTKDCPKVRVEFLQGKDKIQVEGPQNEVLHAASALQDNVNELESHMDFAEVEIEQQFHKHIIGKAGANIRKIMNETGVMIFIPKDADNSNIIRIEGDRKGVKRAKHRVMEIASKMEKKTKKEVIIDQRFHRIIFGAKGKTVQGIRGQFNQVQITFPDQGKKSDTVRLRGPKSDVDKCAVYLVKIAKELECQMDFAEIKIEQQFHKHIIGKTSTEIRRIINETGAMIHIPPHDENNPIICIEGESKGVQRAKQQLMEMASRMEKKKTKCVIIDQRFHRIIFGAKGKTVQGIQGQFNQVQITFPDQGKRSNTVTLRGPKSDVDKCAVYLVKIAKELILEETKTRVDLPSENSNSDMITKSYVEAADTKIEKNQRPYGCNVCNKKFSTKKKRKKHQRQHKEVRPRNFLLVKRFPKKTDYQHSVRVKGVSRKGKQLWHHFHHKDFRRYDCKICDEEHLTKRKPWQHLRHQKDFRCNMHVEEYSERRATCQHLHPDKDISTYQCDICGKRFSTKREMKEHRRHKDIRPYQCNICDDGYSTQSELWQHLRVHKDFRCNKCNNFDEEYPLEMQPWQHYPDDKDFRPSERFTKRMEDLGYGRHCKKITLYEIGGFQEILSKTEKRKLCKSCQCKFCSKRFSRNSEPVQDKKNHNEVRPHQCNICGNIFSTKSGMEQHMRNHKDVGLIPCDTCGKRFLTQKGMKDHKRYHEDVGHYQCDICGRKFSTKTEMEEHRQHHTDVRHYQCDICGKKFSTKTEMEEHRQHHAGDLNHHKCDFCDEIFSTMNELEQHKKYHEDFRPYQCDVCSERFTTKNGMEQHKRHHKDIKPYQCDICEKKFTTKRGMEQHRQHHYGSCQRNSQMTTIFTMGKTKRMFPRLITYYERE